MAAVSDVLIIGGGSSGNALAVLLSRAGVAVTLVEKDPAWGALGSGITLRGNALRILDEVGVMDEVRENYVPAPPELVPPMGRYPAVCGMYRPKLQKILTGAVRRAGVQVRLGATIDRLEQHSDGVDISFSDGSRRTYDLVVGADGINSPTRSLIGIQARPSPTGMAIWRVYARRPDSVRYGAMMHGDPYYIAGYTLVSETHLYAFIVEEERPREELRAVGLANEMRRLAERLKGHWVQIREDITDDERIDYRRLEHLVIPKPWHRGRVIIIGDAAHACPPTLAQGAAMGLEDASVLAGELTRSDDLPSAVDRFGERRYERVQTVTAASVELCDAFRIRDRAQADRAWAEKSMEITSLVMQPA